VVVVTVVAYLRVKKINFPYQMRLIKYGGAILARVNNSGTILLVSKASAIDPLHSHVQDPLSQA